MPIEAWKLKDSENKKKKLTEKDITKQKKKILEHKKVKEKISISIESDEKLASFKDLISKWIISNETAIKMAAWENIDNEVITEIFKKINQIEKAKNINKYLPKELRISKDDYIKALTNDIFRVQTITKLDAALTILANHISKDSSVWINLFSGFLTVLDKNLILIHDNTIDIKDNLEEIDEKKFWKKKDNRSFIEKIIDFLK